MRRLSQAIQQKAQGAVDEIRQAFRGVLHLVKSADNIQKVQASGLADETLQDVELMQQFGFTSVPPTNTQAVILPIGGQTTHGIVIATESGSFRVKNLQGGSDAIFTGDVQQRGGSFTTDGDVTAGAISLRNHKHTGDSGGKTTKPE